MADEASAPRGPGAEHVVRVAAPSGPTEPVPPADAELPPFILSLQQRHPSAIRALSVWVGDWTVILDPASLLDAAAFLRSAPDALFDCCSDLTAVDWPPRVERFDVVYSLYSTAHRHRLRVKARVPDGASIASVTPVWPSVNWLEREVFDMFGIRFDGHPNLRRILMPDEWQGHPQRKDYPLEGPGELLMENPLDWLTLRQARDEADIE